MSEGDVRQQLLQTAARLFSTQGYEGTSIRDICAAAGVAPPAVYYHFGNKRSLYVALVHHGLDLLLQQVDEAMAAAPPDAHSQLRAYIDAILSGGIRLGPAANLVCPGQGAVEVWADPALACRPHQLVDRLTTCLQKAVATGEVRAITPAEAAFAIHSVLHGYLAHWALGRGIDIGQAQEQVLDLFWSGLHAGKA